MAPPRNETEDILHSITKPYETPIKQTDTKLQENLELNLTKPSETFSSTPLISIKGYWMKGLSSLEVYISVLRITDLNDDFSFSELRAELEDNLSISDITPKHLQHGRIRPRISQVIRTEDHKNQSVLEILYCCSTYI